MNGQFSFHRLPQIPNQVKTIGNLSGVRSCAVGSFGIAAMPIPAYGCDAWVRSQPGRQRIRRTLRQNIDHTTLF